MSATPAPFGIQRLLWLELRTEGVTRRFCIRSEHDRSIAVGTLPRADLRINRTGVAPIHFYFERRANQVWLVPAARAELRMNTARVDAPRVVCERAVIEFAGVVVAASVTSEELHPESGGGLGLAPLELGLADLETPSSTTPASIGTVPVERIGHQATLRMFRVDLSAAGENDSLRNDPFGNDELGNPNGAHGGQFDTPDLTLAADAGEPFFTNTPWETDNEVTVVQTTSSSSPTHSESEPQPDSRPSLLAALGEQTKSRPLAVAMFSTVCAALLCLALLAGSRVMTPRPAPVRAVLSSLAAAKPLAVTSNSAHTALAQPAPEVTERRADVPLPTARTSSQPPAPFVARASRRKSNPTVLEAAPPSTVRSGLDVRH